MWRLLSAAQPLHTLKIFTKERFFRQRKKNEARSADKPRAGYLCGSN